MNVLCMPLIRQDIFLIQEVGNFICFISKELSKEAEMLRLRALLINQNKKTKKITVKTQKIKKKYI